MLLHHESTEVVLQQQLLYTKHGLVQLLLLGFGEHVLQNDKAKFKQHFKVVQFQRKVKVSNWEQEYDNERIFLFTKGITIIVKT